MKNVQSRFLRQGYISQQSEDHIFGLCKMISDRIASGQCPECVGIRNGEMPDILIQEYRVDRPSLKPSGKDQNAVAFGKGARPDVNIVIKVAGNASPYLSDRIGELVNIVRSEIKKKYVLVGGKRSTHVIQNNFMYGFIIKTSRGTYLSFIKRKGALEG